MTKRLLFIFCSFLLIACFNPVEGDTEGSLEGEGAAFRINFASSPHTRMVVGYPPLSTDWTNLVIEVRFYTIGDIFLQNFTSQPGESEIEGSIAAGTYTVRIIIHNIVDNSLFATGTASPVTLAHGQTNTFPVQMAPGGPVAWARTISAGANLAVFNGVVVAPDGSVYAAGYQWGINYYIYGIVRVSGTSPISNPMLVKYRPEGGLSPPVPITGTHNVIVNVPVAVGAPTFS